MDHEEWLGDELPSFHADTMAVRESTGIRVKGTAGFLRGELEVVSDGSGRSPEARAVTTLIVALAACACCAAVGVTCLLSGAPAILLGVLALITLAGVLVTGLILAFREKAADSTGLSARDGNARPRVVQSSSPQPPQRQGRRSLHR